MKKMTLISKDLCFDNLEEINKEIKTLNNLKKEVKKQKYDSDAISIIELDLKTLNKHKEEIEKNYIKFESFENKGWSNIEKELKQLFLDYAEDYRYVSWNDSIPQELYYDIYKLNLKKKEGRIEARPFKEISKEIKKIVKKHNIWYNGYGIVPFNWRVNKND